MLEVQLYITRKDNLIKIVYTLCLLLYILYKTYKYIIFGEFWIFQKQVYRFLQMFFFSMSLMMSSIWIKIFSIIYNKKRKIKKR